ncbi:hypothetical protein B0O99DRAFT_266451 [Bisporella sp. PMI_857]|nr:hypothetical protein B0O99DRAFT_266451 [Bisporella sp. PMI_857]
MNDHQPHHTLSRLHRCLDKSPHLRTLTTPLRTYRPYPFNNSCQEMNLRMRNVCFMIGCKRSDSGVARVKACDDANIAANFPPPACYWFLFLFFFSKMRTPSAPGKTDPPIILQTIPSNIFCSPDSRMPIIIFKVFPRSKTPFFPGQAKTSKNLEGPFPILGHVCDIAFEAIH